jgi:phospholipid/cholesterol/gamma-HCH transport system substrate-binding protein
MAQRIEFKVGLFIVVSTLLIIASIGFIAYKKDVFSRVHTYTLSSKTGENLTEGMPVAFWGFTIGRVSEMELTEKGVLIRIKIPERHNRVIRANSRFVLDKPLFGPSRIIVTTDNLNDPPLSPEIIPDIGVSNDINELIKQVQPIAEKVDRIAANVAAVTGNLADPQGDVNRVVRNAEMLTARLARSESLLEMAVGDPESVKSVNDVLKKARDIAARLDTILAKAETLVTKADSELYGPRGVVPQVKEDLLPLVRDILRDLLAKLAKVDTTLENLNRISGEAADSTKDLKVLRGELDAVVIAVGNLVEELDRKIPFKAKREIKLP